MMTPLLSVSPILNVTSLAGTCSGVAYALVSANKQSSSATADFTFSNTAPSRDRVVHPPFRTSRCLMKGFGIHVCSMEQDVIHLG